MTITSTMSVGGILTGIEIDEQVKNKGIIIEPYTLNQLNPNSYNLRLSNKLRIYTNDVIDAHAENEYEEIEIPESGLILYPNQLYIGSTVERVATDKFIPAINGRSSGGRLGISIHVCAGFGDIGFDGTWTLEITVVKPVKIYPNDEIAQVSFTTPAGDTTYLYRGRYYQQSDPTMSKFANKKSKGSLANTAIEAYQIKRALQKLYYTFGDYEFTSHGFYRNSIDASFELREGESLVSDMIFKDGINIGKVYRFMDSEVTTKNGERTMASRQVPIYLRRGNGGSN